MFGMKMTLFDDGRKSMSEGRGGVEQEAGLFPLLSLVLAHIIASLLEYFALTDLLLSRNL